MAKSLGTDIGGTFTDFALANDATGEVRIHKCLTTPSDPSEAVSQGVAALGPESLKDLTYHIHGTTLVINAVIERKGAKTGLITSPGTRDILEIGREKRYDGYDLKISFPEPLVQRPNRLEVLERVYADGTVFQKLEESSVREAIALLLKNNVKTIAVVLLHSYVNPTHEKLIGDIIHEIAPDIPVSLSSDVLPEIKEFERTSTTVINAYAKPATGEYLSKLNTRMQEAGADSELLMMLSSGGTTTSETARSYPVQIIESGPAAGALAAAHYARLAGLDHVLAFDMGGTTAKMCLVNEGRIAKTTEFEIAHVHRFKTGSGFPVRIPVVDLMEIGAGGGSIARVTEVDTVQVGPKSAGAAPGPACYGQGGTKPTVSDADLVLGYLDPKHFLGGDLELDRAAAEHALKVAIGEPLSLSIEEAARGVFGIVNENMASAAKVYVTERGEDPGKYTMVAFGGAGPVHAVDLARRLGVHRVLVPPNAGVASALGMIVAPISFDTVRSMPSILSVVSSIDLMALFDEMALECRARMPRDIAEEDITDELSIDMRYLGQGYHENVIIELQDLSAKTFPADIITAFNLAYRKLYGRIYDDLELEIVNIRLSASAPARIGDFSSSTRAKGSTAPFGHREAYCPISDSYVRHTIYRRNTLCPGSMLKGPIIVEENESTTVLNSDCTLAIDDRGSLLVTIGL
ncbi:MAG: hypothetical protein CBB68_02415 [Rhodospirillaceae bacterium TMED8]|nr:hydantoinase [Magnetovibrio sp.]OUT52229.1 MAG: hypothetical protein CBB68_02415 [Rhodospirillaceae bacterium TMED8]